MMDVDLVEYLLLLLELRRGLHHCWAHRAQQRCVGEGMLSEQEGCPSAVRAADPCRCLISSRVWMRRSSRRWQRKAE